MDVNNLKKTPLYQFHIANNASMVPFAGYEMPVQYANGLKQEHLHTRDKAGLFDISHMGQLKLSGKHAIRTLESLTPSNFHNLKTNAQRYSVLTNDNGGIIDDLMVTNAGEYFFIVINAANKESVIEHIQAHLADACELEEMHDYALLALQGPKAAEVMRRFCPEACELIFMSGALFKLNGVDSFISRCGYTGEDGFEISMPFQSVEGIASTLLAEEEVELIGLGARDSLRLEAGYCLYGHDIDLDTSPIEANIGWVVSKPRIEQGNNDYPGIATIRQHIQDGTKRLRVGILSEGKAPIREGVSVLNLDEQTVGKTCSGGFSPSMQQPIAMAYIDKPYANIDTKLIVKIRNRIQHVRVVKLPFVQHQYHKHNGDNDK